jgi:ABC-type phosphate/phosphonate transport system substrate-binding protein
LSAALKVAIVSAPILGADGGSVRKPLLRARLDQLCQALQAASGVGAEAVDFDDYPSLLGAVEAGGVDFAWLAPIVALRAMASLRVVPIVMPVRRGVASFHSALFSSVGSPIVRPPDLVGVRAAWVERESASGHLLIRAALRARGIDLAQAFSEERFHGSHEAVVRAVIDGTADVGATYLHHDHSGSGVLRAGWGDERVQIVARVGPIPSDVIGAGVHVPAREIRAVRDALSGSDPAIVSAAQALFECDQLIPCESEHLDPLTELLEFLEGTQLPWKSIVPPARVRIGRDAE